MAGLAAVLALSPLAPNLAAADREGGDYLSGSLADRILSTTQQWGELGLDTAVKPPDRPAMKLRIQDQEYAHGLGHHANGEIVVDLAGEFTTFVAALGVQWQGGQDVGSVVFQVFVDGKKAFDSGVVREQDAPRTISVPVAGADELRLVATDAGDGITCDCADWAEARLIRDPQARSRPRPPAVDVSPFAKITAGDPKAVHGTQASRVEAMPAEDLFPDRELLPSQEGVYTVPVTNATGCIGLEWAEARRVRQVGLRFRGDPPAAGSISLQVWNGESAWQGDWRTVGTAPEQQDGGWTWSLGARDSAQATPKVRWLFSHAAQPITIERFSALTRSRWQTVDLRLEFANPTPVRKADLALYNGLLLDPASGTAAPGRLAWDGTHPLVLKVRASVTQPYKGDRTVLRIRLPETSFGIAVEDLLTNDAVYVAHAGLFATRLPAPVSLADYVQRRAGRRSVLEQVRTQPDQDLARAWTAVHLPVEDLEPTMLSLACDNRKFTVRRDGVLGFDAGEGPDDSPAAANGSGWLAASQWQLLPRFGTGNHPQIHRQLRGGWLPAPETIVKDGTFEYTETTCVAPASDGMPGQPSWRRQKAVCVVEFRARNQGSQPGEGRLLLNLTGGRDSKGALRLEQVPEGWLVKTDDRLLALVDTRRTAPLVLTQAAGGLVLAGRLAGGAEARCVVSLPAWKLPPQDYAPLLRDDAWAGPFTDYWRAFLAPAMQIETPDPLLNDLIRASQVHCAIAARSEGAGARVAPWIASAYYGPLESEANSIIRGMDLTGHADFARRSLEYFLSKRNRAGFITTGYTLVGTGEFLWTLAEHYERTRDREWLRRMAPDLVPICRWIMEQRAKTMRLDARGQKIPEYGLMPPGVTADWNRYAYRFFNDAQYWAGLAGAGRALADIGDPAAPAIREDAAQYLAEIRRAYAYAQARTPVVPLANGAWVPGDPAILNCYGRVEDFLPGEDAGRTWCYSVEIGAHHLVATGIIEPRSAAADWMVDWLEDVQFLRSGWPDYPEAESRRNIFDLGGFAKLQPYYCRIAEVHALRNDPKPFIRSFFNTIPSLVNRENLSFCEHFHNYGAWNKTHETGWFLCQARTIFVTEAGEELWLAPFVPEQWLNPGGKVSVRNAPTRRGPVSYTLEAGPDAGLVRATLELPPGATAARSTLRLRVQGEKPLRSIRLDGQPCTTFDPTQATLTLPEKGGRLEIEARF